MAMAPWKERYDIDEFVVDLVSSGERMPTTIGERLAILTRVEGRRKPAEMADVFGVSVRTVHRYRRELREKSSV